MISPVSIIFVVWVASFIRRVNILFVCLFVCFLWGGALFGLQESGKGWLQNLTAGRPPVPGGCHCLEQWKPPGTGRNRRLGFEVVHNIKENNLAFLRNQSRVL